LWAVCSKANCRMFVENGGAQHFYVRCGAAMSRTEIGWAYSQLEK